MGNNRFSTSDTTQAAFIIAAGFILENIDYELPRFEFSFADSPAIRDLAFQYTTGRGLVEPSTYNRITRKLLRIIKKRGQWDDD